MFILTTPGLEISEVWFWVLIIIAAILFDIITLDLNSIWFAAGALVASILAAISVPVFVQIPVFFAVSITLLVTVGKWTRLLVSKNRAATATNNEAYIGQYAEVTKDADAIHPGTAIFRGIPWTIVPEGDAKITTGSIVVIVSQDGNKLIVKNK